jgi:biopolymer transport protein TolR
MSEINVVPYIDVMLVLLVIFMVTAPLLQQGVEIDLPDAPSKPLEDDLKKQEPLIVSVDKQGRYFLNESRVPLELATLKEKVVQVLGEQPQHPVYVRGHERARYANVVAAMVILQNAGADNIGLITEPPVTNTKRN